MKVNVKLTREHIKRGCESRHGGSCPMYWAISEALDNPKIHVTAMYLNISAKPVSKDYLLPEVARNWISRWDDSFKQPVRDLENFEPIEFDISID